jgi:hypothetical protein
MISLLRMTGTFMLSSIESCTNHMTLANNNPHIRQRYQTEFIFAKRKEYFSSRTLQDKYFNKYHSSNFQVVNYKLYLSGEVEELYGTNGVTKIFLFQVVNGIKKERNKNCS